MGAQWKAKHKDLAANARGRAFGKLSKDLMVAARNGADPDMNSRLRLVVEQAKKVSMPRETIERAIKKGAGLLGDPVHFERVTYEGFTPHRVPVIVECLTEIEGAAPEPLTTRSAASSPASMTTLSSVMFEPLTERRP